MDTTTAATTANVTTGTIRRWARTGRVTATKANGRWTIDESSLAAHNATRRTSTVAATFHIIEVPHRFLNHDSIQYKVCRVDGVRDFLADQTFAYRKDAEFYLVLVEGLPAGYRASRDHYRARSMKSGYYWEVTGQLPGDPRKLSHTWDEGSEIRPESGVANGQELLLRVARLHAEGAPERIAKHAEKLAIEAAEAAVREAREAQLDEVRRVKGELATPRQVAFIMQLLAAREISGDGGGFFMGPTDRAGVETLSKGEASMYITSLKGDY